MKAMTDKPWYQFLITFLSDHFFALAGALLSLFMTQRVSVGKGIVAFFVGFLVAVMSPQIVNEIRPIGDATKQGIAFLAGMTGMNLTLGIIRLTIQFKNDPSSIASDFFKIIRGSYKKEVKEEE